VPTKIQTLYKIGEGSFTPPSLGVEETVIEAGSYIWNVIT